MDTPNDGRSLELARNFLRTLSQTIKMYSLYQARHPVPNSSLQEAWHALHDLFAESNWPEAVLGLIEGRWVVNGKALPESGAANEILALVFRSHAIASVSFGPDAKLYELSAFCELGATPPNRAYQTNASEELMERGVRHIRVNVEAYVKARGARPPAGPPIESPIPHRSKRPAPSPPPALPAAQTLPSAAGSSEMGFGAYIKSLIEETVQDPSQRATIYGELTHWVKEALSRHAAESSRRALQEKQAAVNERRRAESVISSVAEGKVVVDGFGRVLMMDPVAESIMGRPLSKVAGKPLLESLGEGQRVLALAKDLGAPGDESSPEEVQVAGSDDMLAALRQSLALVHNEEGRVVGTFAEPPYQAKLREVLRLQDDFLSKVTHDLKAPLASVCAALEIIGKNAKSRLNPEDAHFLDISVRNSRLLSHMINEILDFSKMSSGKMAVHPVPTPAEPLLREAAEALSPWARSKKISLEVKAPPAGDEPPAVLADPGRVVHILNNLVSNAIKSTPEEGRVRLTAARGEKEHEGTVVFSVEDTGCGISEADQKRIFDRFTQLRREGAEREGVGLGLSIAKELVTLHQGKMWLKSAPGRGSTFFFCLPAVLAQPPRLAAVGAGTTAWPRE